MGISSFGYWIIIISITGGVFLVGIFLRIYSEHLYEIKAGLGDLAISLLRSLESKNIQVARRIANVISSKVNAESMDNTEMLAKAIALQILTETSSDKTEAIEVARQTVQVLDKLETMEIKTPFIYYTKGYCYRLIENYQEAINSYHKYLELCPNDTQTESICDECLNILQKKMELQKKIGIKIDEEILFVADSLTNPGFKIDISQNFIGKLVLTDQRIMLLSSCKATDIPWILPLPQFVDLTNASRAKRMVRDIDLSDVFNDGSWEFDLKSIISCNIVKSRWTLSFISITFIGPGQQEYNCIVWLPGGVKDRNNILIKMTSYINNAIKIS